MAEGMIPGGLLASIGRGLKLGAGVLNPAIHEQQVQERALAEQQAQARKAALQQLIISAVQEGALEESVGVKALEAAGFDTKSLPPGVLGPSAASREALRQRQALEAYAGTLTDPRARAAVLAGKDGSKFELGTSGTAPIRVISGDTPEGRALGLPPGERARVELDANGQPARVLGRFGSQPGVNVNVNTAGETAFSKEAGKLGAQRGGAVIDAGNTAANMEQSLTQLGGLLSQGVPTGSLQPAVTGLQGIASDLGLDLTGVAKAAGVNIGSLSTKEEFDRVSTALVIDGFEKFKGNLNQQEVKLAMDAFPKLGRSEEGNKLAIASMLASARLAQERAAEAAQIGSNEDFRRFEANKARAGTKRFEEIRKAVLAEMGASKGENAPPAGARQAPDGNWYVPDPARPGKYLRVDP